MGSFSSRKMTVFPEERSNSDVWFQGGGCSAHARSCFVRRGNRHDNDFENPVRTDGSGSVVAHKTQLPAQKNG